MEGGGALLRRAAAPRGIYWKEVHLFGSGVKSCARKPEGPRLGVRGAEMEEGVRSEEGVTSQTCPLAPGSLASSALLRFKFVYSWQNATACF